MVKGSVVATERQRHQQQQEESQAQKLSRKKIVWGLVIGVCVAVVLATVAVYSNEVGSMPVASLENINSTSVMSEITHHETPIETPEPIAGAAMEETATMAAARMTLAPSAAPKTLEPTADHQSSYWQHQSELCYQQQNSTEPFILRNVGNYVPAADIQNAQHDMPPPYDYLSCYVLKTRYHCFHSDPNFYPSGYKPTDWKLILNTTSDNNQICDLATFVQEINGPKGVADHRLAEQRQANPEQQHIFTVLMTGDSQLRQIWEALVCTFQPQMTHLAVQLNGKDFQPRIPNNYDPVHFLGTLIHNLTAQQGCRSMKRDAPLKNYFEVNVTIPTSLDSCDDDVAMVEFDNSIRFYYINRPDSYINLQAVVDALDLQLEDVDQIVINANAYGVLGGLGWAGRFKEGVWGNTIAWNTWAFQIMQKRDIGQWFGADNVWITDKPNDFYHGCMPGPVDDEVNLLLYLLRSKPISVDMGGFGPPA